MRSKLAVAFVLLVVVIPASASTITALVPEFTPANSGARDLTISGSDLGQLVVIDGPAGHFEVEAQSASSDKMVVLIPPAIVSTIGSYVLFVRGKDGDSNPARFEITVPAPMSLQILGEDPLVAEATSPKGAVVEFEVVIHGDDPNPVISCEPKSGSLFPLGRTWVHCVAQNKWGQRAEGTIYVFVSDTGAPLVTVPDRIVVKAQGPEGAVVTFEATAEDAIDGQLPVECTPPSGSRFPIGVTTVECVAHDLSNNPGYGSFEVEVEGDDEHGTLTIHVPDDLTIEATSAAGAEVRFAVTTSGSDDPEPAVRCDPASGSTFPIGKTTVACIASDRFGDQASDEFDVTVVDHTPPSLMLEDITAEASGGSAEVTYAATAIDAVDGIVAVTCNPPSGTQFELGDTPVHCSATDSHGNAANDFFTVHVIDSTAPHIWSATADPSVLSPANHKLVDVTLTVDVMDANDSVPQCSIRAVTANEPILGPGSGSTDYDWLITGTLSLQLRAERAGGGSDRIYSVEVDCTDQFGNVSGAVAIVTVPKDARDSSAKASAPAKRRSARKP